jgi:hypothetical protein
MFVKDGAPPPAPSSVIEPPESEVLDKLQAATDVPRARDISGDSAQPTEEGSPVEGGHSMEATMEEGSGEEQSPNPRGRAARPISRRPKPRRRTSSNS